MNKGRLEVSADTRGEIELLIALLGLGLCEALREKSIDADSAATILFKPYVMARAEELGLGREAVDLIHEGTEIGDVERLLLPAVLERSLNEMRARALRLIERNARAVNHQRSWVRLEEDQRD